MSIFSTNTCITILNTLYLQYTSFETNYFELKLYLTNIRFIIKTPSFVYITQIFSSYFDLKS
jgi:hypothetical protein